MVEEALNAKLIALREALAEETRRREEVEKEAGESAKRREQLELTIAENQRSQQWFEQLLEQSRANLTEADQVDDPKRVANLEGRRRALEDVRQFVADKQVALRKALEAEEKRREEVKRQVAENAERRQGLETALEDIQQAQAAFQMQADASADPARLHDLETALADSQDSR